MTQIYENVGLDLRRLRPPVVDVDHGFSAGLAVLQERFDNPELDLASALTEVGFDGLPPERRLELLEDTTLEDIETITDTLHKKIVHNDDRSRTRLATREPLFEPVMGRALSHVRDVIARHRESGGDLDDVLQRCGNLLALGVVIVHRYGDGNGRLARTTGGLIHRGFDSSDAASVKNLTQLSSGRAWPHGTEDAYVPLGQWEGLAQSIRNGTPGIKQLDEFFAIVDSPNIPFGSNEYASAIVGKHFSVPESSARTAGSGVSNNEIARSHQGIGATVLQ